VGKGGRNRFEEEVAIATLLTVGHGDASQEQLTALLTEAEVRLLVDVRRFPGSRRNPHFARDAMEGWLPAAGVSYRWEQRLGGRRRVPSEEKGADPWWRVEAFAAYAAYTRTPEFGEGMADLFADVGAMPGQVAVMCSESLWWRCHRRLVSDVAVLLHGLDVSHLGHDGKLTAHVPAAGARVTPDGLRYDVA
jgi:uncharacterized protein (DUF488 family)